MHAKYYVQSGLTNVLKNANKTKNMHIFSIRIANYITTELSIILTSHVNAIKNMPLNIAQQFMKEMVKKLVWSIKNSDEIIN